MNVVRNRFDTEKNNLLGHPQVLLVQEVDINRDTRLKKLGVYWKMRVYGGRSHFENRPWKT